MPIVGTAGHVDHGKSTLVRALTGIDPDRWQEEKDRGLTIDLGFAWTDIAGRDVGFVDVPGHERFIKNMLAGVGGIDCALFVVAADSGWMPQSEEHAAVLDLLAIEHGVIALSRTDLVDEDTIELAQLEIMDEVAGTALEGWPIVPVSAVTGDGLLEVRQAIASVLGSSEAPEGDLFRMWVDRAFRPSGAGLVVTGTVVEGTVSAGDQVIVYPPGEAAKVRSLQHHGEPVEAAGPGSRAAVNLSSAPDDTSRGALLAGQDAVTVSTRVLLQLTPTRSFDAIPDRGAFHLHIGTTSTPAAIRRVSGTDGFIAILDRSVPVIAGDKVILRDSGRKAVVAGGSLLDPSPIRRPTPETVSILGEAALEGRAALADALVEAHRVISKPVLRRAVGGIEPASAIPAGDSWLTESEVVRLEGEMERLTRVHHSTYPLRPGMPKPAMASQLGIEGDVLDAVIGGASNLEETAGSIRLEGFEPSLDPSMEDHWSSVRTSMEASFDVPRESALDLEEEVLHHLLRRGDLIRVGDDLSFTKSQADELNRRVAELRDGFTVSEFKDHFGMARRQAVPTLEWLDSIGRTRRRGDGRAVRA